MIRHSSSRGAKINKSNLNMKLNVRMPNASIKMLIGTILMFAVVSLQCVRSHQVHESNSANEISLQPQTNSSQINLAQRGVTNLHMKSDWRSVRLRWNYVHPNVSSASPAAFEIRYCELTSWLAEIKCRHRDVPVAATDCPERELQSATNAAGQTANSTVIKNCNQQLESIIHRIASEPLEPAPTATSGAAKTITSLYESHIFDLRALTNYTFDVRVSRFSADPQPSTTVQLNGGPPLQGGKPMGRAQQRPARRLEFASGSAKHPDEEYHRDLNRIETKPFQAEALKCLANSSEVLVNTGRYFGGRISVEGQPLDARCQLIGNRTSSQSSYLFRIDHELCRSKLIDSNRIETMILVHENKDILTHNTARFLVQCNIMQNSFTVRASVALPKINSLKQQQLVRPATITMLSGKPTLADLGEQQVRLGSMPGVYRLARNDTNSSQGTTGLDIKSRDERRQSARHSKELVAHEVHIRDNGDQSAANDNYKLELPKPVEVSSRILFVSRASAQHSGAALTRQRGDAFHGERIFDLRSGRRLVDAPAAATNRGANSQVAPIEQDRQMRAAIATNDEHDEGNSTITMINNHQNSGPLKPLSQLATTKMSETTKNRSNDHSDARLVTTTDSATQITSDTKHGIDLVSSQPRSRSGRMRHISNPPITTARTVDRAEVRMGDALPHLDLVAAGSNRHEQFSKLAPSDSDASETDSPTVRTNSTIGPSLTQNITGAIIRWSLRTLGNLARKSLESLAENESDSVDLINQLSGSPIISGRENLKTHLRDGFLVDGQQGLGNNSANRQSKESSMTTSGGSPQQPLRPATQSADLIQSKVPHHLDLPPHPLMSGRSSNNMKQATTAALTTTSAPHMTPASIWPSLTKAPASQHRQQKSSSQDQIEHQLQSARVKSAPVKKESYAEPTGSSPLWPLYMIWGLAGLGLVCIVIIYFLAFAPSSPRVFKPEARAGHQTREISHNSNQPSRGDIFAHFNEAIHRHHQLSRPTDQCDRTQTINNTEEADQHQVFNTISRLLANSEVRSPRVQRRLPSNSLVAQTSGQRTSLHLNQNLSPSPLGSPSESTDTNTTRSTSAASSANSSSVQSGSSPDENYCKNHEQIVYSEYLLLNAPSDCHTNNFGRESFA